jgi:hypothetical protein
MICDVSAQFPAEQASSWLSGFENDYAIGQTTYKTYDRNLELRSGVAT